MSHVAWFAGSASDQGLSKQSEAEEWIPSLYVLARVLMSSQRPLRYLIYNNGCSCELTQNLEEFFKIACKKIIFIKVTGSNLQIC